MDETEMGSQGDGWLVNCLSDYAAQGTDVHMGGFFSNDPHGGGIQEPRLHQFHQLFGASDQTRPQNVSDAQGQQMWPAGLWPCDPDPDSGVGNPPPHFDLGSQLGLGPYPAGAALDPYMEPFLGVADLMSPQHVNDPQSQQIGRWPLNDTNSAFAQAPLAAPTEGPLELLCAPLNAEAPAVPPGSTRSTLSPTPPPSAQKRHQCRDCGKGFSSNKDLVRHCRSQHSPYSYQCWCGRKPISRKDNYHRHMKSCHAEVTARMRCGRCGEETDQVPVHKAHVGICGDGKKGRPAKKGKGGDDGSREFERGPLRR
ncbi:hypothetical protein GGTG_07623 [Gaeumannomyces tritici R3-111a-1]|uniref:C2H2-type domain-containing protein n=1 Tax=Gaeumannomyces tritici (strain R3-111a-1) TaxID=644352 RepID=J3P275_GAET3|nr:hypothetical protein GGTG_07623 [Gaeumannomyces tritici R3-111a-1]EJT73767.1 hypothetical protein GGTG_07623 [Gaeumannomyces tritici R3-111a-1]